MGPEYAELLPAAAAAAITPLAQGVFCSGPRVASTNDSHILFARLPPYVSCRFETEAT